MWWGELGGSNKALKMQEPLQILLNLCPMSIPPFRLADHLKVLGVVCVCGGGVTEELLTGPHRRSD